MIIFVVYQGNSERFRLINPFKISDGISIAPIIALSSYKNGSQEGKVRNSILSAMKTPYLHIVIFCNQEWRDFIENLFVRMNIQKQSWFLHDEQWIIHNACVISGLQMENIMEVYKMITWYTKIEHVIKIYASSSVQEALGVLKQPIVVDGQFVDYRHLVVVDDNSMEIVGVVVEDEIEVFLDKIPVRPGFPQRITVGMCMIPIQQVLKFSTSISRDRIRVSIASDESWSVFRKTRSLFLIDDNGMIVGFATEFDLYKE